MHTTILSSNLQVNPEHVIAATVDILLWIVPRFGLWVLLSAIPINMVINLDYEDDVKNRGKIAMLLFLIFFVIAPFCFWI